jgi:hypothetical protein
MITAFGSANVLWSLAEPGPQRLISPASSPPGVSDDDRIELGLELLSHLEHGELSVKEAMDRIELVTTSPQLQRDILDEAVARGVVERESGTVRPVAGGSYVQFERDVVVKDGEFSCERCGAGISEGHFVQFDADEMGPFGSTCIRKVLGRE